MMNLDDYKVLQKQYRVTMSDGSVWGIPVADIAIHRAEHYIAEYDGDMLVSLSEDTLPLFEEDHSEIAEWAQGNMNWGDVGAIQISPPNSSAEYDRDWCNCQWSVT